MSSLKRIIEEINYEKLTYIHALIPIPLAVSVIGILYLVYQGISSSITPFQTVTDLSSIKFASLWIVYTLASTISAYRLLKTMNQHLVYSSIETYYWIRTRGGDFKYVVEAGFEKKNIPSPITALLITLLTGGLAYPVMLGLFENTLRKHSISEEKALFGENFTRKNKPEYILLDIALTLTTLGLWMCIWIYRAVRQYNTHLDIVHGNHPLPPQKPSTVSIQTYVNPGLAVIATSMLSTGIYGFLSVLGIPVFPLPVLAYTFIFSFLVLSTRKHGVFTQSMLILCMEYIILVGLGFTGFLSYNKYGFIVDEFTESISSIISSGNILQMTLFIFQNNSLIVLSGLVPLLGSIYAGYAVSNTGFLYGLLIGRDYYVEGTYSGLQLLIMPHTVLELYAYALAVTAASRAFLKDYKKLVIYGALSALILLFAAIIESYTIVISRNIVG